MTFDISILRSGSDFEALCLALFQRVFNDPAAELLGTSGRAQHGVDILASRNGDPSLPIGIQCKLRTGRNNLAEAEVRREIAAALKFRPTLTEYVIATTSKNDPKLQQLAAELSARQQEAGRQIRIRVCGWDTLSGLIRRYPDVKEEFHPAGIPTIAGALNDYRFRVAKEVLRFNWWRKPIPIELKNSQQDVDSARTVLTNWYQADEHQHCAIVGEPGSGKTGLMWWLASELVKLDVIVLNISALRLAKLHTISFACLAEITEPRLAIETFDPCERRVYLLLDGLDELAGAGLEGHVTAIDKIGDVLEALPVDTRVVVSCRPRAFALLREALEAGLPSSALRGSPRDDYAQATQWASELDCEKTLLLHVCSVQKEDALRYLDEADRGTFSSPQFARFLTGPFTLQLLKMTRAQFRDLASIALDQLYRTYVKAALKREQRTLTAADCEVLVRELAELASSKFEGRVNSRRRSALGAGAAPHLDGAVRANLVYWDGGDIEFMHYSLWEFFFAENLARQIREFDADILAQVDLVRGDNLNRMLVPMLKRAHQQIIDEGAARVVSAKEYRTFIETTGWRKKVGYGMHPSVGKRAATFSFARDEQMSVHKDYSFGSKVASSISWYDAAAFALWTNRRLPTAEEATALQSTGGFRFWCADWFDEDESQMKVFDAGSGEFHGLNPDIRLTSTALAVI